MNKPAIFLLALLPLAACTSTASPPPTAGPVPVASGSGDSGGAYQGMSCEQLAAAERNAASDIAWARRQQQETFSGGTTSNVSFSMPIGGSGGISAGSGSGPHVGRAKSEQASLRQAMAAKGCS